MEKQIKRVFIPYWEWEDYQNGMYDKLHINDEKTYTELALIAMKNTLQFGRYMKEVSIKWEKSMINSLTNSGINKQAFIGQCALCYARSIPEYITRKAWKMLLPIERYYANKEADKVINEWILSYVEKNKELYINLGEKMLF